MTNTLDAYAVALADLPPVLASLDIASNDTTLSRVADAASVADVAELSGLEVEAVFCEQGQRADQLRQAAPCLVHIPDKGYLVIFGYGRGFFYVTDTSLSVHKVSIETFEAYWSTTSVGHDDVSWRQKLQSRQDQRETVQLGWRLAPPTGGELPSLATLWSPIAATAAVHLLQFSLWIMSWITLARILTVNPNSVGWMLVWIACIVSSVVLQTASRALAVSLSVRMGYLVKQFVMARITRVSAQASATRSLGLSFAAITDANRIDSLAANGAVSFLLGLSQLGVLAAVAIYFGLWPYILSLLLIVSATAWLALQFVRQRRHWYQENLAVTALHTEEMVAQRTRKLLVGRLNWHSSEDDRLQSYVSAARRADKAFLWISFVPRMWMVIGLSIVLFSAFTSAGATTSLLVEGLGFVIVSHLTLQTIIQGLIQVSDSFISVQSFLGLVTATDSGGESPKVGRPSANSSRGGVCVQQLSFAYPESGRSILRESSFVLDSGSKSLLEGASGGGKSTLANLMAGRLAVRRGSVTLDGVDVHAHGIDRWRRLVTYVPQHHQNHVLTESFLFNLLLGIKGPATPQILRRMNKVVHAVGLSNLVERMPAGYQQMVGDGGWQLSQGERARLFLARGLIQEPDVLIVDEPLAALDPKTAQKLLDSLSELSNTLLVVAHR